MEHKNTARRCHRQRNKEIREHVTSLVRYLGAVIHDIKYIVGDLQILLEQIDSVSRRLDESDRSAVASCKHFSNRPNRQKMSDRSCTVTDSRTVFNPSIATVQRANGRRKKTKLASKLSFLHEDNSSLSSWDKPTQREVCSTMEPDNLSVELSTMWDNEFDNSALLTAVSQDITDQIGFNIGSNDLFCDGLKTKLKGEPEPLFSEKLEQSLTSGIEMLSFTDDTDEDRMSSDFPLAEKTRESLVFNVDPNHVCCKDVLPAGCDVTYCGVYEAVFEACLEPFDQHMVESQSFGSDVSLFGNSDEICEVMTGNYEPMYDTQLNTWTAFTMVAVDSMHTSDDDLSDTALDILNDNVSTSGVLDNDMQLTENIDRLSLETDKRHDNSSTIHIPDLRNTNILTC